MNISIDKTNNESPSLLFFLKKINQNMATEELRDLAIKTQAPYANPNVPFNQDASWNLFLAQLEAEGYINKPIRTGLTSFSDSGLLIIRLMGITPAAAALLDEEN